MAKVRLESEQPEYWIHFWSRVVRAADFTSQVVDRMGNFPESVESQDRVHLSRMTMLVYINIDDVSKKSSLSNEMQILPNLTPSYLSITQIKTHDSI